MKRILFPLIFLVLNVLAFQQNDYSLSFERCDIKSYNRAFLETARIVTFKYNRTQPALNATFAILRDLGNYVEVVAQAYAFMSNEYRLFPMRFQFNLCDAITKNEFGLGTVLKHGNFSGCPTKKQTCYLNNWIPDGSRFPPYIPNGQYMLELQASYFSEELVLAQGYATISRPLGRRH